MAKVQKSTDSSSLAEVVDRSVPVGGALRRSPNGALTESRKGENQMGRFTDDMTRLAGEIHAARDGRGRLIRDLKHATVEMKQAVAEMQTRVRSAHAGMARRQQGMLRDFASGLTATVAGVRKEFAADLAGAHRAWFWHRDRGDAGTHPAGREVVRRRNRVTA